MVYDYYFFILSTQSEYFIFIKIGIAIHIVSTIYNIDMDGFAIVFKYAWGEYSLPGKIIIKCS